MTRIRSRGNLPHYERPPLPRKSDFQQHGRGMLDNYPQPGQTDLADWRAILNAQLERDMHLSDLPDINPADFETAAEYEQWIAEGAQRFSA